jgi:hypothetical protein
VHQPWTTPPSPTPQPAPSQPTQALRVGFRQLITTQTHESALIHSRETKKKRLATLHNDWLRDND